VPVVLTDALLEAAEEYLSSVIAYSIMPNHFHYLCCVVEEGGNVRKMADWLKRVSGHRIARLGFGTPVWQRSYWDRHKRAYEKTSHIVDYILDNPVAEGLCAHRDEWPHSAFIEYPWERVTG
jgi:REP element-mobilizing transposase RayT